MKINVVRTTWGFAPAFDEDREALKKIGIGEQRQVELTVPRNVKFHRKYFGLLKIVFDNMPSHIFRTATGQEFEIKSVDSLLWQIKMQLGYFEEKMTLGGRIIYEAKSISFAKMDNAQFEKFYSDSIDIILKYFIDCEKEDLVQMVISEFG